MNDDKIIINRSDISRMKGFPKLYNSTTLVKAIDEVEDNVQAPRSIVLMSALSSISLALQGVIDVESPIGNITPVSLMTLVLGDSGERKTTVQSRFLKPFRDLQIEEQEIYLKLKIAHDIHMDIWKQERKDIIRRRAKNKELVSIDEINQHENNKPKLPFDKKIIYEDSTSQALMQGLSTGFPYAGLVSSEGKVILNGRAFNDLSKQNSLWSGDDVTLDRVDSGRAIVSNARLTVAIMAQTGIFSEYLNKKGAEARGSGLWARFLVDNPVSTQGTRYIKKNNITWGNLDLFNIKIRSFLDESINNFESGNARKVLSFEDGAKSKWIDFFNYIEGEIKHGGSLARVSDHASKILDNATRIAALTSYFEGGDVKISTEFLDDAIDFCMWEIESFKSIFQGHTKDEINAERLWLWLSKYFDDGISLIRVTEIQNRGPSSVRKKEPLEAALKLLIEAQKVDICIDRDRHKCVTCHVRRQRRVRYGT